jgi:hypothetical protein
MDVFHWDEINYRNALMMMHSGTDWIIFGQLDYMLKDEINISP